MARNVELVIQELSNLQQNRQFAIIKLGEPLIITHLQQQEQQHQHSDVKRSSDVSSNAETSDTPTPRSLEADLTHYKELFAKLRFSYLEQVTKEKFLRSLIEQPLPSIPSSTLVALELHLATQKSALQEQKAYVADIVAAIERQGRELSQRYHSVHLEMIQLRTLPEEIAGLREAIEVLGEAEEDQLGDGRPEMRLPLSQTSQMVTEREAKLAMLDKQLEMMETEMSNKTRELSRLEAELKPLEAQKWNMIGAAKEARRRKEEGTSGIGDALEEQGRWLQGVEATMRSLLHVEG